MKNLKTIAFLLALLSALHGNAQTIPGRSLNVVISNYLALKDALANNNGDEAEVSARLLLTTLKAWPESGIPAAEAALIQKLKYDSRHISEVNRLAHQREHFESLSASLISLLKENPSNRAVLYVGQSPFHHAYFLADSEGTKDPFTGLAGGAQFKKKIPAGKNE